MQFRDPSRRPSLDTHSWTKRRVAAGVVSAGILVAMTTSATSVFAQWSAGGSVYSDDGIEITVDPRVVSTFAVLNALGYDEESRRGPAPLNLPRYSDARDAARNAMGRPGSAVTKIKKVVKQNPVAAEAYAQAATKLGPAPRFVAADGASKLEKGLSENLRNWYNEEGGAAVVRTVQSKVGDEQKKLLKPVNATTASIKKIVRLGDEEDQLLDDSGPNGRVVLSLNPLDTHGAMTVVTTPALTTVVAGPLDSTGASTELLGAVAFAYAKTLVGTETRKVAATAGTLLDSVTKAKDKSGIAIDLMACAVVKVSNPKFPCVGSTLEGNAAMKPALDALTERFATHAKTSDPFAGAVQTLFGPLAPVEPAAPAPAPAAAPAAAPAKK